MKNSGTVQQLAKFGLIGVTAVCLDFVTYYLLLHIFDGQNVGIAKSGGFIIGTIFTYVLNKSWTWKQKGKSTTRFVKFLALYFVAWGVNVGVNALVLLIIPNYDLSLTLMEPGQTEAFAFTLRVDRLIAFGASVVVTSAFTFIGQKFWVFKNNPELAEEMSPVV